MSNSDYIDIKSLVKKIIEGDIQINKPLLLTSKDRTEVEKLSFLSHIMKHNGVKKDTLFIFLNETLEIFNNQLVKLMKDQHVQKFIDNIKKEWGDNSDILFKQLLSEDKVKMIEELLENLNKLCREFKELNMKIESNNITDILVEDELLDNMGIFIKSIEEFNNSADEIISEMSEYELGLNKINMNLLLDLSMKDKQIYLQFNNIESNDKISENIHNIFLNYVFILNLIKKHFIYYRKVIDRVKEISKNMGDYTNNSKISVKKSDTVFMTKEYEKGVSKYLEELSD